MKELNVEDSCNLTIKKITAESVISSKDAFQLDSDGNLTVKSLKTDKLEFNKMELFSEIYPIGSIYMSIIDASPAILFGGIWEKFSVGRTLVGVDTSQIEFDTVEKIGGEKSHTLTVEEIPTHWHEITFNTKEYTTGLTQAGGTKGQSLNWDQNGSYYPMYASDLKSNCGGKEHNNLQPFITCYIWKRIS